MVGLNELHINEDDIIKKYIQESKQDFVIKIFDDLDNIKNILNLSNVKDISSSFYEEIMKLCNILSCKLHDYLITSEVLKKKRKYSKFIEDNSYIENKNTDSIKKYVNILKKICNESNLKLKIISFLQFDLPVNAWNSNDEFDMSLLSFNRTINLIDYLMTLGLNQNESYSLLKIIFKNRSGGKRGSESLPLTNSIKYIDINILRQILLYVKKYKKEVYNNMKIFTIDEFERLLKIIKTNFVICK